MLEALGVVEDLHDEGDGGDVGYVGEIGEVGVGSTAVDDAANTTEGVGHAGPRVPFGREHT